MFLAKQLLLGFGLACLVLSVFFFRERYNPNRLAFAVNDLPRTVLTQGLPAQTSGNIAPLPQEIIIKDINLNLPVFPEKVEKGRWKATTKGVSYLTSSPIPGEKGNSILYGHNWPNLLGNIVKLKTGQVIQIKFPDNSTKNFVIDSLSVVSPEEVSILNPSNSPQITLYTCTGFLDSKRFVVVAKLKN